MLSGLITSRRIFHKEPLPAPVADDAPTTRKESKRARVHVQQDLQSKQRQDRSARRDAWNKQLSLDTRVNKEKIKIEAQRQTETHITPGAEASPTTNPTTI